MRGNNNQMEGWAVPPARLQVSGSAVDVWWVGLDQPPQNWLPVLSADERDRAERFRFAVHRQRFIVGRGTLRAVLARYLDLDAPRTIRFQYGPQGKPALVPPHHDLRFNVSHTENWALIAVTAGRDIGIDLEKIRPLDEMESIAARVFAPAERDAWLALPPAERAHAFFRCWSRKEAYVKGEGTGLSHPLESFAVSLAPGAPAQVLQPAPWASGNWSLCDLPVPAGFSAALATDGPAHPLRCWVFPCGGS